jgi:hypothetical protein
MPSYGHDLMRHDDSFIGRLLNIFALFIVPACVVVYCVGVALAPDDRQTYGAPAELDFRVVEDSGGQFSPQSALAKLEGVSAVSNARTALSSQPFWFAFSVNRTTPGEPIDVELPSRHARETTCWNAATLESLGFANRLGSAGTVHAAKSGFVIDLNSAESVQKILCRATFVGPARISVRAWSSFGFEASMREFSAESGLLEGAQGMLVLFLLIGAVAERDTVFLVAAAWAFATMRLSAITLGSEFYLFGQAVPPTWELALRPYPAAFLYVLSVALFSRLFGARFKNAREFRILHIFQWLAILLFAGSALLPGSIRLPILWLATGGITLFLAFLLVRSLVSRASLAEICCSAALGVSVSSYFYDTSIFPAGMDFAFGLLRPPWAALLASALMALAVGDHSRSRKKKYLASRGLVGDEIELAPIGLFLLNDDGEFRYKNSALRRMLANTGNPAASWQECFGQEKWDELNEAVLRRGSAESELRLPMQENLHPEILKASAVSVKGGIVGSIVFLGARSLDAVQIVPLASGMPVEGRR